MPPTTPRSSCSLLPEQAGCYGPWWGGGRHWALCRVLMFLWGLCSPLHPRPLWRLLPGSFCRQVLEGAQAVGRGPMALCLARLSPVGPRGQWQEELEELTHSSALSLIEGGNRVLLLLETSIPAQRESACLPAAATDRCVGPRGAR